MKSDVRSFQDWQKYHFEVEREYANKILATPKGSELRKELLEEGYGKITEIIDNYNPGAQETAYHTDMVVGIIEGLISRGSSVFDVGCASANLVIALLHKGYKAKGIDVSKRSISSAIEKLKGISSEGLVQYADISNYQCDETFDCIVMDNVIEHLVPDTISDVLEKCYDWLNEKGYLIVFNPHRFSGPHDISQFFLPIGAKAEGFHFKEFTFTELDNCLREAGFQEVLGFPFHPGLRRLNKKGNLKPSVWAANKAKLFERIFAVDMFKKVLSVDRAVTQRVVELMFPTVCVGVKK